MTKEEIILELELLLLEFVKESVKYATARDARDFPAVAGVLVELLALDQKKER